MTDLSPAAQAILIAYWKAEEESQQEGVAAALRAAADQVLPAEDEDVYLVPWNLTEHMRQRQDTRRKILAIADELQCANSSEWDNYVDRATARLKIIEELGREIHFDQIGWELTEAGMKWKKIMNDQSADEFAMGL